MPKSTANQPNIRLIVFLVGLLLLVAETLPADTTQVDISLESESLVGPFIPSGGLPAYLAYAAKHSPALKAAHEEWQAAVSRAGYAGALADPMFSYGYMAENGGAAPMEQQFSLMQSFPWPGTLGAMRSMAEREAEAAYQGFRARTQRLLYDVRLAYYDYYSLAREIEVTEANFEILTFWETVVRNRYRTSLSPHPDLMKVQVELAKLENRLATARARVMPAAARLQAALNLPDTVQLPLPAAIQFSELSWPADSLARVIEADNPSLQAMSALIERARSSRAYASRSTRPDFSLGVDYILTGEQPVASMAESGRDRWMISVGVSLPLWFGKNSARKREAEAAWRASRYLYEDARNSLRAAVHQATYEHDNAVRAVRLYRDGLIPKAEQLLQTTFTAYQAETADFLAVLDAQRQYLEFQLELARNEARAASREAELEMLTGHELD